MVESHAVKRPDLPATDADRDGLPSISVVSPMYNEALNIDDFVADLAAQDFDGEVELIVADGGSTDGSVERLRAAARAAGLDVRVVDNPRRWVSPGLNACIAAASGDLIVRLDCHSRYPPDYLRRSALAAEETGAWHVGGRLIPDGRTPTERAVACAMDVPFGGIGWTRAANANARVQVDTLTFGAYRSEVFRRVGGFDDTLIRGQDEELNLRIHRAGGRTILDPTIVVRYRPRGSLIGVWRQYYGYGLWKVAIMLKHRRVLSLRSLAPLTLVVSTGALGLAGARVPSARRCLAAQAGAYLSAAVAFAVAGLRRRGEPLSLFLRVVATFPVFHFGYGLGMLHGWLQAVARRFRAKPAPAHREPAPPRA
jgi:succinoglycan biosynthesis protein ExoA